MLPEVCDELQERGIAGSQSTARLLRLVPPALLHRAARASRCRLMIRKSDGGLRSGLAVRGRGGGHTDGEPRFRSGSRGTCERGADRGESLLRGGWGRRRTAGRGVGGGGGRMRREGRGGSVIGVCRTLEPVWRLAASTTSGPKTSRLGERVCSDGKKKMFKHAGAGKSIKFSWRLGLSTVGRDRAGRPKVLRNSLTTADPERYGSRHSGRLARTRQWRGQ
ncbi:hypothetical protein GCM10018952_01130 [Streptosporangium vulgare]